MQLGLTIPLIKHLRIPSPPYGAAIPPAFCWELHCITLRGESALLAVHCQTRYTMVHHAMTHADWHTLADTFVCSLSHSLHLAGFDDCAVQGYFQQAGDLHLTKTHGRRTVAYLNRQWDDVVAADSLLDPTTSAQPWLEAQVNGIRRPCAGYAGADSAHARFAAMLTGF